MLMRNVAAASVFLLTVTAQLAAQEQSGNVGGTVEQQVQQRAKEDDATKKMALEDKATTDFAGLEFGAGISVTLDGGHDDRIRNAAVIGGVVRITERENAVARIMLESHYFFLPNFPFWVVPAQEWGFGPFVALQPGTDDIIDAAAMGIMIGFRRAKDSSQSFNLGAGVVVDPNSRVLGEGLFANQPLPNGETEIRYQQKAKYGFIVVTSFSF
jgi:hypothetical protein